MNWYWHLFWGAIVLVSSWKVGNAVFLLGVAFVNIEKSRNERADKNRRLS